MKKNFKMWMVTVMIVSVCLMVVSGKARVVGATSEKEKQTQKSQAQQDKEAAKNAFRIQNQYRKEKGLSKLVWSEELYEFALYRLKTSGYDKHKYHSRDKEAYFGSYSRYSQLILGENLYSGSCIPRSAMRAWKNSPSHYSNIVSREYKCGAIARYKNIWCAIFYGKDKEELVNWEDCSLKTLTIRRLDSDSGRYVSGSAIGYYEEDDRWGTLRAAMISDKAGKRITLEGGKRYVIYERKAPRGCKKAKSITITVTPEMDGELVLTDES